MKVGETVISMRHGTLGGLIVVAFAADDPAWDSGGLGCVDDRVEAARAVPAGSSRAPSSSCVLAIAQRASPVA